MLGAVDLVSAATLLAGSDTATEAHYRRAISTAYYGLFHHVLAAGAARFLRDGNTNSSAYSSLYRGFSHGRMKSVCEALTAPNLGRGFARQLRRLSISPDLRAFADFFLKLQEARHLADYDPLAVFTVSDAEVSIKTAEDAMAAFDRAEPAERDDVLALMLTSPPGVTPAAGLDPGLDACEQCRANPKENPCHR